MQISSARRRGLGGSSLPPPSSCPRPCGLSPFLALALLALTAAALALQHALVLRSACEARLLEASSRAAHLQLQLDSRRLAEAAPAVAEALAAPVSAPAPAPGSAADAAAAAARTQAAAERTAAKRRAAAAAAEADVQRQQEAFVEARRKRLAAPVAGAPAAAAPPPRRVPLAPFPLSTAASSAGSAGVGAAAAVEPAPKALRTARALLVICYNRPDYLRRTLQAVFERMPSYNRPHIYVSQDGQDAAVAAVVMQSQAAFASRHPDVPFTHLRHPGGVLRGQPKGWDLGYFKLSQHFGWALDKLFVESGHPRVIVLEDDIEVAVDFFDFFSAAEPLLDADDGLLAASAYSDTGQRDFAVDPRQVMRSDFFPGLGWMLTRHAWEELGPKWPEAYWDDWLREPPNRRARQFLRPEVSRAVTFGESGVSNAQFFKQFLGNVHLNDVAVDWVSEDTSYLARDAFAADFRDALAGAEAVPQLADFVVRACADAQQADFKHAYVGTSGYSAAAGAFGFISDLKAGVPRTAYMGTVIIKHRGCRKFIFPLTALDENNALPH